MQRILNDIGAVAAAISSALSIYSHDLKSALWAAIAAYWMAAYGRD